MSCVALDMVTSHSRMQHAVLGYSHIVIIHQPHKVPSEHNNELKTMYWKKEILKNTE